jgi:hypothetical protein
MEKVGLAIPKELSFIPQVRAGIVNEPRLRAHMESVDDTIIMPGCYAYDGDDRFRASLDGLSTEGVVYEFKWPGETTWMEVALLGEQADAYRQYRAQTMAQMLCTDATRARLVFGREGIDGIETIVFDIHRNDAELAEILKQGGAFLAAVATGKPPAKDVQRDCFEPENRALWLDAARHLRDLEVKIVAARRESEALNERREALLKPLIEDMGEFMKADYHGVAITRYMQDGSVSWQKVVKDKLTLDPAELAAYRGKASMRQRITIKPEPLNEEELANDAVASAPLPTFVAGAEDYF